MPQTLTLGHAREALWKYASNVDFTTATDAQKLDVDNAINQVCERFITQGKWRGSLVKTDFAVFQSAFTLPDSLEVALKIFPVDATGRISAPAVPFNQWYSILGPSGSWSSGLPEPYDLGEGFATFRDVPFFPFYIKAVADVTETSKNILLRGTDAEGKMIYSGGTKGVARAITAGGTTTTQQFRSLNYWVKSGVTNGPVRLYAVAVTGGPDYLIGNILPGKLVSNYRRYAVPWPEATAVRAICKRAYVPARADNDPLTPSHLGALKLGLMSLKFEDAVDFERAGQAMNEALALLESDRAEFDGDHRLSIDFPAGYGPGAIPNLI